MAHFSPSSWEICMTGHRKADLDTSPVTQAVFVHEYMHYLQTLVSTVGRSFLGEQIRIVIWAGLHKQHGATVPGNFPQVNLRTVLASSSKGDFVGSDVSSQYGDVAGEMQLALTAPQIPHRGPIPSPPFFRAPYTVGGRSITVPHIVVATPGGQAESVPLTDRVFFENMARQIQRRYLLMNNPPPPNSLQPDTSPVDVYRQQPGGDRSYVCLHDFIAANIGAGEDAGKWTIAICQVCLLSAKPGEAFEQMASLLLAAAAKDDLKAFLRRAGQDSVLLALHDSPPLQDFLNEMSAKWLSAVTLQDSYEAHQLLTTIALAHNVVMANYSYFDSPLMTWAAVAGWVRTFGCPPVRFDDGEVSEVAKTPVWAPWQPYFERASQLL